MQTEKGQLEEAYWRNKLLTNYLDHWTAEGYDVDEMEKSRAVMPQQETLMKMFAVSTLAPIYFKLNHCSRLSCKCTFSLDLS